MNMYLSYNNVFFCYLFFFSFSLFFWHKMQMHPAPDQGAFCIISCLIIITMVCQWNK